MVLWYHRIAFLLGSGMGPEALVPPCEGVGAVPAVVDVVSDEVRGRERERD